ncbi:MAG TPA: septum formation initiator family protein, partial [Patescibacteria group bacterium]|nr:septum formation initiator family protein [Patescibacteria group bacterium]
AQHGALRFVRWPLLFAGSGALLLIVSISAGRETYQQWQVDQEISGLRAQVETLQGKKVQLLQTIQQLNSTDVLDKEARLRLDLKKPGEQVIVLRGLNPGASDDFASDSHVSADGQKESNPVKWFHYFFSH